MSKNTILSTTNEKKLKHELELEEQKEKQLSDIKKTVQTTISMDANLFYAVKEIALRRKKADIKPNTITGIIRFALEELVNLESNNLT